MQITPGMISHYLRMKLTTHTIPASGRFRFDDVRLFYPDCPLEKGFLYCCPTTFPTEIADLAEYCFAVPVSSMQDAAARGATNLIVCECAEMQLFALLQNGFYFFAEWHNKLNECLLHNGNLNDLLQLSAPVLNNPVFIDDMHFRNLAFSQNAEYKQLHDPEWAFVVSYGHHSDGYVHGMIESEEFHKHISSAPAPFIFQRDALARPAICGAVRVDEENVGYISVLQMNGELDDGLVELTHHFSKCVGLAFARENGIYMAQNKLDLGVFLNRLYGNAGEKTAVETVLKEAGLAEGRQFYIIKMLADQMVQGDQILLLRTLVHLETHLAGCKLLMDKDSLVVLVNGERYGREEILAKLTDHIGPGKFTLGISMPFASFAYIHPYYEQAGRAIRLGPLAGEGEYIFHYEDVVFYDLITRLSPEEIRAIRHPAVDLLRQYDRKRGTELLKTLHMLFRCNGDIARTAKELFVHRNSVYYRVNQVCELGGVDLQDERTNQHLKISLQIQNYLDEQEKQERPRTPVKTRPPAEEGSSGK